MEVGGTNEENELTKLFDFKIPVETKIEYTTKTLIENWSENTDYRIDGK